MREKFENRKSRLRIFVSPFNKLHSHLCHLESTVYRIIIVHQIRVEQKHLERESCVCVRMCMENYS